MLITFKSIGYVYISKICFDFLKRIITNTSLASTFCCCSTSYLISKQTTLRQLLQVNRRWQRSFRTRSSLRAI